MRTLGLERAVVDRGNLESAVDVCRERGVRLPTFGELCDPSRVDARLRDSLADVDPDAPDPRNLFRVHWYNDATRTGLTPEPGFLVLPPAITGVAAPIAVLLGERFPMIAAHKVLAAYACLVPRIVTGQFDPARHRALWPSTGNYCRGGVAVSRILGCRGVAILPEGMSRERFDWLDRWVADPADVIRTPGTESNVKEIYDACEELSREPDNVIFNQFCEFGNHLVHRTCTGRAAAHVVETMQARDPALTPFAWIAATGSAGTLAAGDYLKERFGARIVAVEALECPTLLECGFGEHNIQGIGDKHVPYIHNALNTDFVAAVSDRATDRLFAVFNTAVGREYLAGRRGVPSGVVEALGSFGFSGIANVVAAIRLARAMRLGPKDLLVTVATDGSELYESERERILSRDFEDGLDAVAAAEVFGEHVLGATTELVELDRRGRERIFNLGYYTWVEQRGVDVATFNARRDPAFWTGLGELVPAWDALIDDFNARTGLGSSPP